MLKTKYERKYQQELKRELKIENCMKKNNWKRQRATHQVDYESEMKRQNLGSKLIF